MEPALPVWAVGRAGPFREPASVGELGAEADGEDAAFTLIVLRF